MKAARVRPVIGFNTGIPLFAGKPSHPFVPLGDQTAGARSEGQGRPSAGACALPLTAASTLAGSRHRQDPDTARLWAYARDERPWGGEAPPAAWYRFSGDRKGQLRPYLDHGILELDDNAAERGMRAIALGRKNYLFVGSEAGGKAPPSPTP